MLLDGVRGEAYTPFKLYTELHGNPAGGFHFWCEPRKHQAQAVCIKSHDAMDVFVQRHPPAPIIYLARDARDALLSYYFFTEAYAGGEDLGTKKLGGTEVLLSHGKNIPIFDDDRFSTFIAREAPAWLAHVSTALQYQDRICFLTYESLMLDFESSLRRAIEHTKLSPVRSYAETRQVYHTEFSSVFRGNNQDFFRRGQIGDWKNWYTAEHARQLDLIVGRQLIELGFESDPNWARIFTPAENTSKR